MGGKCLSHPANSTGWRRSRKGLWEGCLGLGVWKYQETGENSTMLNFTICTPHQISLRWSQQRGWDGRNMWHTLGRTEIYSGFWRGNVGVKGRILKRILKEQERVAWAGLIWLKTGTNDGLLWMRLWTLGFHKMRGLLDWLKNY